MARYVRFLHDGVPRYGRVEGTEVAVIDPHPFARHQPTGERVPVAGLTLLAPVIPSKVVGVSGNHRDDTTPAGDRPPDGPQFFLKPSSSVIGPGEAIRLPSDQSSRVDHEAEVAVVIGALLQRVTPDEARAGIFGVTAANDVTARDLQEGEPRWFRAKGFDSFCPLGPAIATDVELGDLAVRCRVDGEIRQESSTGALIVDIPTLVSTISEVMTLLPGDVVLTGTPAGAASLAAGQRVAVEVDGVGVLENPVVDRGAPAARVNGSA